MGSNDTLRYRVGELEKQSDKIDEKIDKIMENHLPHIEMGLLALKTRVNVVTAINISAVAIAFILSKVWN